MAEKAILFDTSQCSGCKGCQAACKCWNDLPSPTALNADAPSFTGTYQNPPDLSGVTRLVMTFSEEQGGPKGIKWAFGRRSCQHCGDAPCATICPAGAIFVDEATGLVTTDAARCIGCRFCASACPFDVPRYVGDRGVINKCTGCVDRVANGLAPACVTTCQPGALSFGDRDEMAARAEARAAVLRERGYADAVAYGADEVGGLHVIQVLKYGAAAHGQRPDPAVNPAVQLTQVMKPVTGAVTGLTVAGLAAMFALGAGYRRDRRAYNPATGDTLDVDTREVIKHGDGQDTESVKEHILENLPRRKGGDHE